MTRKNQITGLIIGLAMLLAMPATSAFANDFSIYGNEINTLLQGAATPLDPASIALNDNLNIYGSGFDALMSETNRVNYPIALAGLSNMSVYGSAIDAYVQAPLLIPRCTFNLADRLVTIK